MPIRQLQDVKSAAVSGLAGLLMQHAQSRWSMPKKIPKPRKDTEKIKKPHHVHDDHGRSYESGGYLYTHCTCGELVAKDKLN